MKLSILFALAATASVLANPNNEPFEARTTVPRSWKRSSVPINKSHKIPLRIGLTQQNMHRVEDVLMDVSDPSSVNYGKHWTPDQVAEYFAPEQDSIDSVFRWLAEEGISENVRLSKSKGWVMADVSVEEAERLLKAKYHQYQHSSGFSRYACDSYTVPGHVRQHVELITPTIHFDHPHVRPTSNFDEPEVVYLDEDEEEEGLKKRALSFCSLFGTCSTTSSSSAKATSTTKAATSTSTTSSAAGSTVTGTGAASDTAFRATGGTGSNTAFRATTGSTANGKAAGGPQTASLGFTKPLTDILNIIPDILNLVFSTTSALNTALGNCDSVTNVLCLKHLYNFASYTPVAASKNSFGVVEYSPQAYLASDLNLLFKNLSLTSLVNVVPTTVSLMEGVVQTIDQGYDYNAESNLDLSYAMGLTYPTKVTLYQVGDESGTASFNNFLDALDASYCGGDDPTQDGTFPAQYCGKGTAAKVISQSYALNEGDLTPAYAIRQCNEYAKLGLLGTTFVFAAGDSGVAGTGDYGAQCYDSATGELSDDGTIFGPSFPSTCPYVLSVGATQTNTVSSSSSSSSLLGSLTSAVTSTISSLTGTSTVTLTESACSTVIYSGGGFSNVFAMPSYQKTAIANYYKKYNPGYSAAVYNNSQAVRGYPDVSANGANYIIAVNGVLGLVYGTSASTPVVASIISLINDARLAAGKSALGYVNPTLYSTSIAATFNDITSGSNPGCGTNGFSAVAGWDPVTGLGTFNFGKVLPYFLALP
ncbi:hypothetical protein MNV49_000915 [Pseudohyphozyma bogoriensis]|nr:hypothetical protein MNV49_000915 [Pseudohyphozyma bogoriensis]